MGDGVVPARPDCDHADSRLQKSGASSRKCRRGGFGDGLISTMSAFIRRLSAFNRQMIFKFTDGNDCGMTPLRHLCYSTLTKTVN
jgi:hypothetical protein